MKKQRRICSILTLAVMVVGGCEWPWPLEGNYDPYRCEEDCKSTEVCYQGKCTDPFAMAEYCSTKPLFLDKDVDVLFVIDDTNSMEHEQKNLKNNFSAFIDAIKTSKLGGKIPNLHVGIASTDLGAGNYGLPSCGTTGGDQGKLHTKPQIAGCTAPSNPWISYNEGKVNIPGASGDPVNSVKTAFQCIAEIGLQGCGFEQTLQSARRALDPSLNVNPGFLRNDPKNNKDALLAVIFITDEDDCSASNQQLFDPSQQGLTDPLGPLTSFRCFEFGVQCQCSGGGKCDRTTQGPRKNCVPGGKYLHKVENFISFFQNLKKTIEGKPNPSRVIMAAIAGPTDRVEVGLDGSNPTLKPSCQTAQGFAVPGIRIKKLVHEFARKLTLKEKADIQSKTSTQPYWVDSRGTWREENYSTICSFDFSLALKRFGESIEASLGTLCLDPPALTDNGGIICQKGDTIGKDSTGKSIVCQQSCLDKANFTIQEVSSAGRSTITKCPAQFFSSSVATNACGQFCPCWRVIPSDVCKNTAGSSPYAVDIMRKGQAPKGTYAMICATNAANAWGSKELAGLKQCN